MAENEVKEVSKQENNVLALLGFIFSLTICLAFPGLILSIIGLVNDKNYKNSRKGMAIAGVVISGIFVFTSLILYCTGVIAGSTNNSDPASSYNTVSSSTTNNNTSKSSSNSNTTTKKNNNYTLGDTFEFDGFEITFDKNYSFVTLNNQFSEHDGKDVVRLGATIKNNSGTTDSINMFFISYFGSNGTELDDVNYYFDENINEAGDLRDGASIKKYFYFLYDGNGKYGIDFNNFTSKRSMEFDLTR